MSRFETWAIALLSIGCVIGCVSAPVAGGDSEERQELSAADKSLVLDATPTDIPERRYIDFNGKVELLGYSLEPARLAAPGSKLSLKLFWRSTGKLTDDYRLYTEIVTAGGKRFDVEGTGPLRQGALKPTVWEPGKIYIDELDVTVPADIDAARFAIVVGLKTAPISPAQPDAEEAADAREKGGAKSGASSFASVHLRVSSGAADAKHGGIVAWLDTGVTPGAKRARTAKDERRGLAKRPFPPSRGPVSAKPRDADKQPAAQPAPR